MRNPTEQETVTWYRVDTALPGNARPVLAIWWTAQKPSVIRTVEYAARTWRSVYTGEPLADPVAWCDRLEGPITLDEPV